MSDETEVSELVRQLAEEKKIVRGIQRALRSLGAKAEHRYHTFKVNGVDVNCETTPLRSSLSRAWTGLMQITVGPFRRDRRWRTRSTGWDFNAIAKFMIRCAEAETVSRKLQAERDKKRRAAERRITPARKLATRLGVFLRIEEDGDVTINSPMPVAEVHAMLTALQRRRELQGDARDRERQ